ncbi:hypothetical protein [Clostridium sp. YIM B02555]|jgi:hypothetical protein|uniref:hypothetical protein n=1 Tax=Clostridium sp. YIM B02555 TaxID=2911968 RepID=UPI001EEE5A72|nr:hypothetical protein [Clostridium sp. YIM B02555]
MAEVDITVGAGAYNYTVLYELLEVIAGVISSESVDNAGNATGVETHTEVPNLTWVVTPGAASTFTYTIRITVTSTTPANITGATANTRSLNSIIFG